MAGVGNPEERAAKMARELLAELRAAGASVRLSGHDMIEVEGAGAAQLIERVRSLKGPLIAYLTEAPTWPCDRCGGFAFDSPGTVCYWCKSCPPVSA